MFDWNDEELGNLIWGEDSDVDDHIVPYPKGSEVKKLQTSGGHRKKQYIQESRHVKLTDQEVSGPNSVFSGFKHGSITECNPNEAHTSSGAEVDSWPDSPLTDVGCEGEYAEQKAQNSVGIELSDFGTELHKYGSAREDTVQPDDESPGFGNDCKDKVHGGFLEYSWENIGSFDDLDNMFRNDDPIFGRESLASGELWSSAADLFSSPTKSFPACSSSSGLNAMCMADSEMKLELLQPGNPSFTAGFGRTDHLESYDIDLNKDKTEYCHYVNPGVDRVGENSKTLLEKTNTKMVEEPWNNDPAIKVNGKRKVLSYPTKEESKDRPSQGLTPPWHLTANQFSSFGNQFANSCVQTAPFTISSPKQPVGSEPWLYWQAPYLSVADGNPQHHYPMIPTMPKFQSDRDTHQPPRGECGNSAESLKHANCSKDFATPPRPSDMTPQEKVEKLKRRQQMHAMLAIQEQQQHFVHKTAQTDLYNIDKCSQGNQHQDTSGSTIEVDENLKIPFNKTPNSPTEHDDSNTVSITIDDCSLEEKVLNQLQDVIGKLDIKVRLCVRDSLYRLAQSAMQRNNNMDTSSTNFTMQYDVVGEKAESYGHSRLPRIPEVETQTNPIDRTVAHLLFHQPLEQPTLPVKDDAKSGSPCLTKFHGEPKLEGTKSYSAGCLPDSVDNSSPSCMESDTKDVYQFQSSGATSTPLKTLDNVSEDLRVVKDSKVE